MYALLIFSMMLITPVATFADSPNAVAVKEVPAASHALEAEFWTAFKAKAIPGLSIAQARPFARALAAGPEKSALFSYLIQAMLVAQRPAESPYFGNDADAHVGKLVAALRAMEKPIPAKEDVIAALRAFDTFAQTHTASLNLNRAAQEILPTAYTAMMGAQHLRRGGESTEVVARWTAPVSHALERLAQGVANKDLFASAAGLYLYAHWVTMPAGTPLEPMRYTDISFEGTQSVLHYARKYAAWSAWHHFWPALDPSASETKVLVDILNRDPVLARSNFVSVMGLTPGNAATFGAKYRKEAGLPDAKYYVVAGNPPQMLRAGNPKVADRAVWAVPEPPDVKQVRKKVMESREALNKELERYRESRRFWGLDQARENLAQYDGTSSGGGRTPTVESVQRGLDAARDAYQKDLRDGVYVGRSLERSDTIYTRELNSMERRAREFELERLERQLADEQREAQRQWEAAAAREKYRDQLTDEIFEKEKKVDTRGHLAKVAEMKKSIAYYEDRYESLLKQHGKQAAESGVSAESIARAQFLRDRLKDATVARYDILLKKAQASKASDDEFEVLWYAWLFDFPELRDDPSVMTFYGTKEAEEEGEDKKQRGKLLVEFAEVLLEPLSPKGPTKLVSGLNSDFQPRFPPAAAWRLNQVAGLLDDLWFRFSHDPYTMRGHVFQVVKALRATTTDDTLTVDSLRPWVKRFRAHAPQDFQRVVLSWDQETAVTELLSRAK